MTGFERRWADRILEGLAGASRAESALPYAETFDKMRERSAPLAAFGMRLALWLVVLSPLWSFRRLTLLPALDLETRTVWLGNLSRHRRRFVRELVLLLKMVAAFALFKSVPTHGDKPGELVVLGFKRGARVP